MRDDGDVCVGSGRARVLVGTRAASDVALAVAAPALAVVPRRSWRRWSSWCWGSMGRDYSQGRGKWCRKGRIALGWYYAKE